MGVNRDLKKATEAYWGGKLSQEELLAEGKRLRLEHWKIQKDAGIDIIPSNDFSYYDHVLDHIQLFSVRLYLIDAVSTYAYIINCDRSAYQTNIPNIIWTPLKSFLQWEGVFKSLKQIGTPLSMFLVWYI